MITRKDVSESCLMLYSEEILDNSNAHEMSEAITQAQNEGYRFIILNLAALRFISSAGVGAILGSVGSSRAKDGDIILCNASERIRHIFEILDLSEFLTMVADETAARGLCPVGGASG